MAFAELCDHLELHLPDRGQPPAGIRAPRDRARPARLRHRRPQLGRRPRPRPPGAHARPPASGAAVPRLAARRPALPRRGARAHRAAAQPRRLGPALPAAHPRRPPAPRRASACSTPPTSTDLGDLHLLLHPPPGRGLRAWLPRRPRASPGAPATPTSSPSPRYDGQDAGAHRPRRPARRRARPAARRLRRADDAPRRAPPAGRRADLHPRGPAHRRASAAPRSPTPSAGCAPRPRCCGSSPATRPRSTAPARSPRTAASALDELRYEYPKEIWDGEDPQARLERLTAQGPEVALSRSASPSSVAAQADARARA